VGPGPTQSATGPKGKIASPATVSRSGLSLLDLVVSDCRLQPLALGQVEAVQGGSAVYFAGLSGTNDVTSGAELDPKAVKAHEGQHLTTPAKCVRGPVGKLRHEGQFEWWP
jgi:hypothetical protein